MSIIGPTSLKMRIRGEYCGREFEKSCTIVNNLMPVPHLPLILIPPMLLFKLLRKLLDKKGNRCSHCERNLEFLKILSTTL